MTAGFEPVESSARPRVVQTIEIDRINLLNEGRGLNAVNPDSDKKSSLWRPTNNQSDKVNLNLDTHALWSKNSSDYRLGAINGDPSLAPRTNDPVRKTNASEDGERIIRTDNDDHKTGKSTDKPADGTPTPKSDPDKVEKVRSGDGSGYDRVYNKDGGYTETGVPGRFDHDADRYIKTVDRDGNSVTRWLDQKGGFREVHSFVQNPEKNYSINRTKTEHGYEDSYRFNESKKNYTITHTEDGKGGTKDQYKYESDPKNNHTVTRTTDGHGTSTEKWTYEKDPSKNHTVTRTPDGKNGTVEKHVYEGDPSKNYTWEKRADGTSKITDATGLQIEFKNASPEFQERMRQKIASLPEAERRLLAKNRASYLIVGTMRDADALNADKRPRGWTGGTWMDADGAYLTGSKQIVIAERTSAGESTRTDGVFNHETGHAIDHALDDLSKSKEFRDAYEKDKVNHTAEDKEFLRYLLLKGDVGPAETFAEIYAALRGATANPEETARILRLFPHVAEYLAKKMRR